MSTSPPAPPDQGLTGEQVAELLRANGLEEVVARADELALRAEVTRHREAVDGGEEASRWRLAPALERLALTVRDQNGRRQLFEEAFLCRRALDLQPLLPSERLGHLVCLAADALAAERRAELMMLLRSLPAQTLEVPTAAEWPAELLMRVARAFITLARRSSGWTDVRAASEEIARLRELQGGREATLLPDAGASVLSSLVALYNLARMVDLAAEYLVSGSPADVGVRLDRHHANVAEITELSPEPVLSHLADLLLVGLRSLVDGSVWTSTRGLGARIASFVDVLTGQERQNPVLELWPSQRTALRSSLLDPAKRALVIQMPTSSGKTLVAEFAVVQALALNPDSTVAYLVPTRALVNQVTLRLRADLAPLGYVVEAAVPVFDLDPVEDALLQDRIHVLVTTPEKFDLLLRQDHAAVRELALVVADEAHNLGDGERGARLELVLGKIKRERPGARFLLLSPFLPNARDLATWLGDDSEATVSVDWKPTELVTSAAEWLKLRRAPFELRLTTVPSAHFVSLRSEVKISLGEAQAHEQRHLDAAGKVVALLADGHVGAQYLIADALAAAAAAQRERDAQAIAKKFAETFVAYGQPGGDQCGAGDRLVDHMQDLCACEWLRQFGEELAAAIRGQR